MAEGDAKTAECSKTQAWWEKKSLEIFVNSAMGEEVTGDLCCGFDDLFINAVAILLLELIVRSSTAVIGLAPVI